MADELDIDIDDIRASLDEEESSRIELKDGYTLILVDVPITEIRHDREVYTTLPLAIILTQDIIMTVSKEEHNAVIAAFIEGQISVRRRSFVLYIRYCSGQPCCIRRN